MPVSYVRGFIHCIRLDTFINIIAHAFARFLFTWRKEYSSVRIHHFAHGYIHTLAYVMVVGQQNRQ